MAPELNHTIVHATDKVASATFLKEVMGLGELVPFGPFLGVVAGNGVTLDFMDSEGYEFQPQHYAFLVSEDEFDQIFGRVQERGLDYWADPHKNEPGEINTNDGGRGIYFDDPDHHLLEILTRPYGSGS